MTTSAPSCASADAEETGWAPTLNVNMPATASPSTLVVCGVEYEIVRLLGTGSYARVFEVLSPNGERLAAKCIDKGPLSDWARNQLASEVQIQQSLLHPNILRLHASSDDQLTGRFVCILDVATGGELFERIMERQSFVEDDARRVVRQLLAAVAHMHKHGILHRDLKPENILLETNAEDAPIKVADFGSAKQLAQAGPSAFASTPCGSMGYAAPEQIALHRYEREVDMWSVGIIAYVLLSGSMPFDPAHYADALTSDNFEVVLLPEQWEGVSLHAKEFVLSLLQLQPERRPKVEQALKHPWLGGGAFAPSPGPPPQLATPRQLKRLHQAGMLHHTFAHANEIWHYACSTPNVGGGLHVPEMPSPLLLPTAIEVPMARDSEVQLLPPGRLRERTEAQRTKRRKVCSSTGATPSMPPAEPPRALEPSPAVMERALPPPLGRDTSFGQFELDQGKGQVGSMSSPLGQGKLTLSNEL